MGEKATGRAVCSGTAAFARWCRYPAPVEWQAPDGQVDIVYIQDEYAVQLVGE